MLVSLFCGQCCIDLFTERKELFVTVYERMEIDLAEPLFHESQNIGAPTLLFQRAKGAEITKPFVKHLHAGRGDGGTVWRRVDHIGAARAAAEKSVRGGQRVKETLAEFVVIVVVGPMQKPLGIRCVHL